MDIHFLDPMAAHYSELALRLTYMMFCRPETKGRNQVYEDTQVAHSGTPPHWRTGSSASSQTMGVGT